MDRVRRVIGRDRVERAVGEPRAAGLAVGLAERSGGAILVLVSKPSAAASVSVRWWGVTSAVTVMPRSRARRIIADAARRRDVRHVQVRAGHLGAAAGRARPAPPRPRAGLPGRPSRVETGPSFTTPSPTSVRSSQWTITGSLDQPRVLEHAPHHAAVHDRLAVVGERHRAGRDQRRHLGHHLALEAARRRGDREHARGRVLARAVEDEVGHRRVVVHGMRVRHAGDRGEAARHRRAAARGDVFLVLLAGLAQVAVQVDEARRHPAAARLDHLRAATRRSPRRRP